LNSPGISDFTGETTSHHNECPCGTSTVVD
jgi:hypothetical protein